LPDLIHNERVKLRASTMANVGTAFIVAGLVAPLVTGQLLSSRWPLLINVVWIAVGILFRGRALRILGSYANDLRRSVLVGRVAAHRRGRGIARRSLAIALSLILVQSDATTPQTCRPRPPDASGLGARAARSDGSVTLSPSDPANQVLVTGNAASGELTVVETPPLEPQAV
jgi:hypothetical protein